MPILYQVETSECKQWDQSQIYRYSLDNTTMYTTIESM